MTRPSPSCQPGHIAMFRTVAGMCNIEAVWELLLFPEVPLLFHPLVGVVTDQAPLLECLYARTKARNAVAKLVVV